MKRAAKRLPAQSDDVVTRAAVKISSKAAQATPFPVDDS